MVKPFKCIIIYMFYIFFKTLGEYFFLPFGQTNQDFFFFFLDLLIKDYCTYSCEY